MTELRTAFALAGLGGNNAYGAGFLAAAQHAQRQRTAAGSSAFLTGEEHPARAERMRRSILPELEFISCTSGAIATTATYLQGGDLLAELQSRIEAVQRATGLPRIGLLDPWRAPAVALVTGVPGVFGPWLQAFGEHVRQRVSGFFDPGSDFYGKVPSTLDDLLDLWQPARAFVPLLPEEFFESTATTFNDPAHGVGVALNSFHPRTGVEHLYVNDAGLRLIRKHHDRRAEYGRSHGRTIYQPITPTALRAALWLFNYGFPAGRDSRDEHVDGAYCRSIILDELTFADRIYAVKPINHRWIGRLPQNLLEVQDMQTELWMGASYREQARLIDTVNRLHDSDRLGPPSAAADDLSAPSATTKHYHHIDLVPVEIALQRGFFTYFVEDVEVYHEAFGQAIDILQRGEGNVLTSAGHDAAVPPMAPAEAVPVLPVRGVPPA